MAGYPSNVLIKHRFHSAEDQQADKENSKRSQHQLPQSVAVAIRRRTLIHDSAHHDYEGGQRVQLVNLFILRRNQAERVKDRHQPEHHQVGGFDDVARVAHKHIRGGGQERQPGEKDDFERPDHGQPKPLHIHGNPGANGEGEQEPELDQQVDTAGQDGGDGHYLARNGQTLDEAGAIDDGSGSAAPGDREEVVRDHPAKYKQGEMRRRNFENLGPDEGHHPHHHQRIQQRPQHAQGHVPVADPEILHHQVLNEVQVVAMPHLQGPMESGKQRKQQYTSPPGRSTITGGKDRWRYWCGGDWSYCRLAAFCWAFFCRRGRRDLFFFASFGIFFLAGARGGAGGGAAATGAAASGSALSAAPDFFFFASVAGVSAAVSWSGFFLAMSVGSPNSIP